ncbi:MAG TPA: hypothetical protein VII49_01705 [Rhizomicrobium sp.]
MNPILKAIALKIVQAAVMSLGAWLATKGVGAEDVQGLEGSLIFLAGFAPTIYDVFVVDRKVKAASAGGAARSG